MDFLIEYIKNLQHSCNIVTVIERRKCILVVKLAGGRNVDDQNVDRPKISERRNGLFS
jgi:hypothetical protein